MNTAYIYNYFPFIPDFRHISCRYLMLHSSLHTLCIRNDEITIYASPHYGISFTRTEKNVKTRLQKK